MVVQRVDAVDAPDVTIAAASASRDLLRPAVPVHPATGFVRRRMRFWNVFGFPKCRISDCHAGIEGHEGCEGISLWHENPKVLLRQREVRSMRGS